MVVVSIHDGNGPKGNSSLIYSYGHLILLAYFGIETGKTTLLLLNYYKLQLPLRLPCIE